MNQKNEEENLQSGDNSIIKSKLDWSNLIDIESLISQMNMGKKIRCIVFDTETTGVNYKKDHILELACVELINFGLTGKIFHIYIKPRVFVPKNVQELNHIRYDDFKKYWENYNLDTKTQLQQFLEFVGNDSYLVAHNATFDYYFLNSELKFWGLTELPNERFRCTLRMAKKYFKSQDIEMPNFKLITLCEYFKILVNENEGSFHNGLFDTIMTSKLFIHLYKKKANIKDYENPQKYNNDNNKQRYNKFDPENWNKIKEKNNDEKKVDKKEVEVEPKNTNIENNKNINIVNNNINISNIEKKENKENPDNKNEKNNEISEGKLNGVELNLLIHKMNEMIINEENKEKENQEITKEG